MAQESKRRERARRKSREAVAGLLGLGAMLLLAPLFVTTGAGHQVVTGLRPMALFMLIAGGALLWWQSRQSVDASLQSQRRVSQPDPRYKVTGSLGATTGKAPALATRAAQQPPTEWSKVVFDTIEWRRFEAVVEALFGQAGFITKAQRHGPDGGVDVWLFSKHQPDGSPVSLVQCKHWHGKRVGVDNVRELRGVMAAHNVGRGQFATTSEFTSEAELFAKENGINLLNLRGLLSLISQRTADQQAELLQVALEGEYWKPTCANCGTKLIERTPKNGGTRFWGCTNYPRCRTTMPMRTTGA
jgi:restriction system protein